MTWFYCAGWIGDTAVYGVTLMAFGTSILLFVQAQDTGPPKSPRKRTATILEPLRRYGPYGCRTRQRVIPKSCCSLRIWFLQPFSLLS